MNEHCVLCLQKQAHVCYECCEDRHKLVKMELGELRAKIHLIEEILIVKFGVKIFGIPKKT